MRKQAEKKMRLWRGIFSFHVEARVPFLHTVIAKLPAICSALGHKLSARRKTQRLRTFFSLPRTRARS